jgi:site-specific recombinase XerD
MLIYKGIDIPNAQIVQSKYGDKMIHIIFTRKGKFADEEHEHDQKFCGRPSRPLMKYEDFDCTTEEFEKIGCKQCQIKLEKLYNKVTAPKEEVIPEELMLENKIDINGNSMTNLDMINVWKNDSLRDSKSEGTVEKYDNIMKQLALFANKPFNEIQFSDIRRFLLTETKRSKATRQTNWYCLCGFFSWADYMDYLPAGDPCQSKEAKQFKIGGENKKLKRVLSQEEINRIANYMKKMCRREDYIGFLLLLKTGARISEITNLTLNQMRITDYQGHEIYSFKLFGKRGKWRYAGVGVEVSNEIRIYLQSRGIVDGYLLRNEQGQKLQPNHFNGLFERITDILGIEHFSPHNIRHTFGTRIYNQTGDIKKAKEALGHESINTTDIYTHVTEAEQIDNMITYAPKIESIQEEIKFI